MVHVRAQQNENGGWGEDFARVFDEVIRDGKEGEFVFKKSLGLE